MFVLLALLCSLAPREVALRGVSHRSGAKKPERALLGLQQPRGKANRANHDVALLAGAGWVRFFGRSEAATTRRDWVMWFSQRKMVGSDEATEAG